RLKPLGIRLQDDELAIIVEKKQHVSGVDDCRVGCDPRPAQPQHLAGGSVKCEELTVIPVGETVQDSSTHNRSTDVRGNFLRFPHTVDGPTPVYSPGPNRDHSDLQACNNDEVAMQNR